MFELKPFMGWGPGTYAFKYAPFQLSKDKTIISTNAGDLGNAHSEYIGPLAESGIFGSLTFILILIASIYSGVTLYFKLTDEHMKGLVMALTLGLITYYIHGFLNNFLDTDKASCPFWGFMAMLVMIECYHLKETKTS
jgi:O-antigen ligase